MKLLLTFITVQSDEDGTLRFRELMSAIVFRENP